MPEQGQVAVLLAIAIGLPSLASELLPHLTAPQPQTLQTLRALADTTVEEAASAQLDRLNTWLAKHPKWNDAALGGC